MLHSEELYISKRLFLENIKDVTRVQTGERFRKQRNHVTCLKRQSIRHYFAERCGGGVNSKSFWPTIKPFITNKGSLSGSNPQLVVNEKLITDPDKVAEAFNQFFVNVVKDIGENSNVEANANHPSVTAIKASRTQRLETFAFQQVDEVKVKKYINKIGLKKATGLDNLSPKILRMTSDVLAKPITNIVNCMVKTSVFPDVLKIARVTPVHKKNDTLTIENYRPVSILPAISKVFERTIGEQLIEFFIIFSTPCYPPTGKGIAASLHFWP